MHSSQLLDGSMASLRVSSGRRVGGDAGSRCDRSLFGVDTTSGADTAILREVQVHTAIVPAAGEEQDSRSSTEQQKHIENTKEDEALGDTDDVAAVRDGKGDGVQEPEEVDEAGQDGVVAADLEAQGMGAAGEESLEGEEDVGKGAKGVESPLVTGGRVGRAEV
jgi:hypothetical protein